MALYSDFNDGLFDHLAGYSALITALGGTAIYNKVIPLTASLPALVYSIASGGEDNDSPLEGVDVTYLVKAVSISSRAAETLADLVYARLHNATITLDAPWSNYHTELTQLVDYSEREKDGDVYYHTGGLYRIRASG